MANPHAIADNNMQRDQVAQAKQALAILEKHAPAIHEQVKREINGWESASLVFDAIKEATAGKLIAQYLRIKVGLAPKVVEKPEPEHIVATFELRTPHKIYPLAHVPAVYVVRTTSTNVLRQMQHNPVIEFVEDCGDSLLHRAEFTILPKRYQPKPAQADLSESTDTTQQEPAEKPVAESVEAPAPVAEENAKDSAEVKLLPIQDLKVGDTFIWDKTSVKKPIRLTIQSIEYGEKGDPQHYNTTLPDGEFISMKLFVPSWKYQGKQVKVVRS